MNCEIERKFLVVEGNNSFKGEAIAQYEIAQGYICRDPKRTVRVRIRNDEGFLTIKGASDPTGTTRFEWERPISLDDARALMALCEPVVVEKTRYVVPFADHIFEVDIFHGSHSGLTLAEIELTSPDEPFERPEWLGIEVTGDPKYYNAQLSSVVN